MRTRFAPLVALAAALLAGCARSSAHVHTELRPGEEVVAQAGASVRVVGTSVQVIIERIADSRCPVDVTCVTAGDALVALRLTGGAAERRDTLRLAAEPRSVRYAAYVVSLVDVRPVPRSTDTARVSVAVLRVSAGETQ